MTRNGVPPIIVVEAPGIPFGASDRGMSVAEGKITKVLPPEIVVSAPGISRGGLFSGSDGPEGFGGVSMIVAGPGMARKDVPSMTVVEAPGMPFGAIDKGMFVAEGRIKNVKPPETVDSAPGILVAGMLGSGSMVGVTTISGTPFCVIVWPVSPGGAFDNGMDVADGTNTKGVLLMNVVRSTSRPVVDGGGTMSRLVELGMMKNGVFEMMVRLPVSPGGAIDTGIFVELGMIWKVVP